MARKLTLKQERFVCEYLTNGGNASAAYRAAYSASKMSEKVLNNEASKLLKNRGIAMRLAEARETARAALEVTHQTVLEGLLTEARREGKDASHGARVSAWNAIGKHLGFFEEDNQQKAVSYEDRLRALHEKPVNLRPN